MVPTASRLRLVRHSLAKFLCSTNATPKPMPLSGARLPNARWKGWPRTRVWPQSANLEICEQALRAVPSRRRSAWKRDSFWALQSAATSRRAKEEQICRVSLAMGDGLSLFLFRRFGFRFSARPGRSSTSGDGESAGRAARRCFLCTDRDELWFRRFLAYAGTEEARHGVDVLCGFVLGGDAVLRNFFAVLGRELLFDVLE